MGKWRRTCRSGQAWMRRGFSKDWAFASCRDGSLTVIGEKAGEIQTWSRRWKTADGARTMGLDPMRREIFSADGGDEAGE